MKKIILILTMFSAQSFAAPETACKNKNECKYEYNENIYINNNYYIIDYSNCIKEYFYKKEVGTKLSPVCELKQDLELSIQTKYYKMMKHNPRRVKYWEGSYSRDVITTFTKHRELVDSCSRTVLSKQKIGEENHIVTELFPLYNVNLDDNITESYMTTAITKSEALSELENARKNCQDFKLEDQF